MWRGGTVVVVVVGWLVGGVVGGGVCVGEEGGRGRLAWVWVCVGRRGGRGGGGGANGE